MSVAASTAVFRHSASKGAARLVLLAMADEANGQGLLTAYRRSQSWLAAKANIDERTTRRAIRQLIELGEVELLAAGDGRASSDYRLLLPGLDDDEGGQDAPPPPAPRPPTEGDAPAQGGHHAPPIIPFSPVETPGVPKPTRVDEALDAGFDRFWTAYPRKTAKGAARKAWPSAVKRAGGIDRIVKGAGRYAAEHTPPHRFTAHPASWLNADRWDDEPVAKPPEPGGFRPDAGIITDRDGPSGRIDL